MEKADKSLFGEFEEIKGKQRFNETILRNMLNDLINTMA